MSVLDGDDSLVPPVEPGRESDVLAPEALPRLDLSPSAAEAPAAVEPNWNADIGNFRGRRTGAEVPAPELFDTERVGRLPAPTLVGLGDREDSAGEAVFWRSGNFILLLSKIDRDGVFPPLSAPRDVLELAYEDGKSESADEDAKELDPLPELERPREAPSAEVPKGRDRLRGRS